MPREIPAIFFPFIRAREGVKLQPYPDSAGVPTIYVGHVIRQGEVYLHTIDDSDNYLRADASYAAHYVEHAVKVPLNDNQFAALISFTMNEGVGSLSRSTLLKHLNAGDYEGAAEHFAEWNKEHHNGVLVESDGLTNRRMAEVLLFQSKFS